MALCLLSLSIAQNHDLIHAISHSSLKWSQTRFFLYVILETINYFYFQVDFGEVFIPPGLDVPRPRVLPEFKRLAHGLRSSNISVLDAKTFYIPNLHYDGAGPDAYFWLV